VQTIGRTRNEGLDGVRGFAALAVVFAHFAVSMGLLPFAPLGFMGVTMFFALSGYLIGGICWRMPASGSAYLTFLHRRVVRLGPVILALAVVGGPVFVVAGEVPAQQVMRDAALALSQTTAFATTLGVVVLEPFRPTWSLSVEWAFYLLFPLALMVLRRSGMGWRDLGRAMAAVAAILYLAGLGLGPVAFYHLPVSNLGVLFAGAALSIWHVGLSDSAAPRQADVGRTAMALVMLSILVVLPGPTSGWGWKLAVVPTVTVCTLALIHGCWSGNRASTWLSVRPLREVGVRAYSLYLWHLPIMWLVWVTMPDSSPPVRGLAALAVIVVTVHVSFTVLERPVLGTQRLSGTRARSAPDKALSGEVDPRLTP
jgi:peptidoglycan/LPS O-acetylase OafA/YrhL